MKSLGIPMEIRNISGENFYASVKRSLIGKVKNTSLNVCMLMLADCIRKREGMFERERYIKHGFSENQCNLLPSEARVRIPYDNNFMLGDMIIDRENKYIGMITGLPSAVRTVTGISTQLYAVTAFSVERLEKVIRKGGVADNDILGFADEQFMLAVGGFIDKPAVLYAEGNIINGDRKLKDLPHTDLTGWKRVCDPAWGSKLGDKNKLHEEKTALLFRWIFLCRMMEGIGLDLGQGEEEKESGEGTPVQGSDDSSGDIKDFL